MQGLRLFAEDPIPHGMPWDIWAVWARGLGRESEGPKTGLFWSSPFAIGHRGLIGIDIDKEVVVVVAKEAEAMKQAGLRSQLNTRYHTHTHDPVYGISRPAIPGTGQYPGT
jgi:hypothetical protein